MTQSVLVLSYNGQTEVFVNMYGPKQVSISEPGNEFDCAKCEYCQPRQYYDQGMSHCKVHMVPVSVLMSLL